MSSWTPQPEVSQKEMVGRRAFTKKLRQPNGHYKPDIFMDDRLSTGLSVDRLGIKVEHTAEITSELKPLCGKMGEQRGRTFTG